MHCGRGIIGYRLCRHSEPEGECGAPFVCDYAENADGLNIIDNDKARKWRQANGYRST